jgi:hypothetical protein
VFDLLNKGRSKRNPQAVKWYINKYYLEGVRDFSNVNYMNGTVSVSYFNEAGILKFRNDDLTAKYQAQLGRLEALDLSPAVERKGISLDGMRKASVAQVVLDSAFSQDKTKKLTLDVCPPLLLYGTIGVGGWIDNPDSLGIEVIPPWEIIPLPIDIAGPSDVRGLMRVRYVPVEWIKNLTLTPSSRSKEYSKIDNVSLPVGSMPLDIDSLGEGALSTTAMGGGFFVRTESSKDTKSKKKKDETHKGITQFVEVWTETSDGYLNEYMFFAGVTKLNQLYRHNHSQHKYHMPVRIIRDVTVGSFWGRSFVDMLIPFNHEMEYAFSSLFEAVSDFDLYGLQLWPTSLGVPPLAERGQDGIKRIRYEPDYTTPELRPDNVMPAKMTAPQIQAIQLGSSMMDKIANQPAELMQGGAPGRVDSSAGLGLLYEISGIPLSPTAKNLAEGVSGVYRAMLRILKDIWTDQKVVNISNLDDSLAGIILDAESGTLSLSQNAIPYPDEVSIGIASEVPVSKEKMKMELKEALKENRITLEEFSFEVRKRGLNLPVGLEVEWQNYRRAMLENILLFGDGETPGQVTVSERDLHRIHLNVLDAFMARPEFYAASPAVRDKFAEHYDEHKMQLGVYPEQLPMPEEIAEQAMEGMPPMTP